MHDVTYFARYHCLLLYSKHPSRTSASIRPTRENLWFIVVYSCICCHVVNEHQHYGYDDGWGASWLFGVCIFVDNHVFCVLFVKSPSGSGGSHCITTNTRLLLSSKTSFLGRSPTHTKIMTMAINNCGKRHTAVVYLRRDCWCREQTHLFSIQSAIRSGVFVNCGVLVCEVYRQGETVASSE